MSDFIRKPVSTMDSVAAIRGRRYEGDRRLFLKSGAALAAAGAMTSSAHADDRAIINRSSKLFQSMQVA